MLEIDVRKVRRAGRITLRRPAALNALTYSMCEAIETALNSWQEDPEVELAIIDAEGTRAFCAGGDIAAMYESGRRRDFEYGRRYWRLEYRMNATISNWPKPVVTFMNGYTMGGGVGLGCHASHRIVELGSRVSMPECAIGLIPDAGGSYLLSRAPGRLGEFLGITGARMTTGDTISSGFADYFVPAEKWPSLIQHLAATANCELIAGASLPPPEGDLAVELDRIDALFSKDTLVEIESALRRDGSKFSAACLNMMSRNSPFSMACALELVRRQRDSSCIQEALELEFRNTYRSMEFGDFVEGIRALIIDKDNKPNWRYKSIGQVPEREVGKMMSPLGA